MADTCSWILAWRGRCIAPATSHDMCEAHAGRSCVECGEPATHDCEQTMGPLICGCDLCDNCTHTDPSKMLHGPKEAPCRS